MSTSAVNEPTYKQAAPARARPVDALILLALMLLLWQAVGVWTSGIAVAPPLPTLAYLVNLLQTSLFWDNAAATLEAFLIAFAISAVAGLALGLIFGTRPFASDVAEPILSGFYTIPKVTLYPVVLLVFGLGISAKIAFGVMHGLVPVVLFTLGAVRSLPPVLVRTARVLRLSRRQTMLWVLLPACLPDIVGGLRISFSLSLLGVLIGEMFSSQRGLGFLLVSGIAQHNVLLSTSVITMIVIVAIVANMAMLHLSRRLTHRSK